MLNSTTSLYSEDDSPGISSVILQSVQADGKIKLEELPSIRHTSLHPIRVNGRLVFKELRATHEDDAEGSWQTCHAFPTCQSRRRSRVEMDTLARPETDLHQTDLDRDFSWPSSEISPEKLTLGQNVVKGHGRRGRSGDMSDGRRGEAEHLQAAMMPTSDNDFSERTSHRSQSLPLHRSCGNRLGSSPSEISSVKLKFATDMKTFVHDAAKTIETFRPKTADLTGSPSLSQPGTGVGGAQMMEPDAGWTMEESWGCMGAELCVQLSHSEEISVLTAGGVSG